MKSCRNKQQKKRKRFYLYVRRKRRSSSFCCVEQKKKTEERERERVYREGRRRGRQKLSFINEKGLMEGSKCLPFGLVGI